MSLSAFIRDHHEEIISEFAVFAKTLMPAGTPMTEAELRDHAEDILTCSRRGHQRATDQRRTVSQVAGSRNCQDDAGLRQASRG